MLGSRRVVVTGAAGFIGMHLVENLLEKNFDVIGLDNFRPSYGGVFCESREIYLNSKFGFKIQRLDLSENGSTQKLASLFAGAYSVIHLAAWPGVRLGQISPHDYSLANLTGFSNILEAVRVSKPRQFMFASSSSVYGDLGASGPVKESDATGLNLKSYYAATKWTNEIMARQHFYISGVPTLALRFFTVYGEFGRPDMAYWTFLKKILGGDTLELYGNNGGVRNFTYVRDCVEVVSRLTEHTLTSFTPINIALGQPIETSRLIALLSQSVRIEPKISLVTRPFVDVEKTWSDSTLLESMIGTMNPTTLEGGVSNFVSWYSENVNN